MVTGERIALSLQVVCTQRRKQLVVNIVEVRVKQYACTENGHDA